jgi:hypothetical protein
MSFQGEIEAHCPKGCDTFETQIWSFVNGEEEELRNLVRARELNMLLCPSCGAPFFPEEPYIYFERSSEILAFVFPESFRAKEDFWRAKMHEDFLAFEKGMKGKLPLDLEPQLFFGTEGLADLLERETFRGEERDVMAAVAAELGLSVYAVRPSYSREHDVPMSLPHTGKTATRESVLAGLEKLVAANDRLTAYVAYLQSLKGSKSALPPAAR